MGLLDVNVLIQDADVKLWYLYYYKPFTPDCSTFSTYEIDKFSSENYTNKLNVSIGNLFPPKQFTFLDCPLYVGVFTMIPFVILNDIEIHGIDITIVNQISSALHLIPKYVQAPDKKGRGVIFENGTATGAVKMVRKIRLFSEVNYCEYERSFN